MKKGPIMATRNTGNKTGSSSKGKTKKASGAARAGRTYASHVDEVAGGLAGSHDGAGAEAQQSVIFDALEKLGVGREKLDRLRASMDEVDVSESIDQATKYLNGQLTRARTYTRKNPKTVAGGTAGLLVGASLLAYALSRASDRSGSKSGAGSKGSGKPAGSKAGAKRVAKPGSTKPGGSKAGGAKSKGSKSGSAKSRSSSSKR